eukprot:TRINITY_DN1526_c0_g1_i1.p1 TRINITY_DN1526_c0_g1~~TRINITY_DN1526_c0_g1_i1.p1  ORF type:complete len:598 (-),score=114.87 TRINITY_DN1526_c0_g1_i1:329-2044(-)
MTSVSSSTSSATTNSSPSTPINETKEWIALQKHAEEMSSVSLRTLMADVKRNKIMNVEYDGMYLDFCRQRIAPKTVDLLYDLAEAANMGQKIKNMREGAKINTTEKRAVQHAALRAAASDVYKVDGVNVVPAVHKVLKQIQSFSETIRSGEWKGATGKALTSTVSIGIGGSYLGAEFVAESLHTEPTAAKASQGRSLRFLANVDPVGVTRALESLDPETTLVVIVSKTFTTPETMLNARSCREWIVKALGKEAVAKHMVAVSTNLKLVSQFGIDPKNTFEFWDWVGGRYSVCSAVGMLPLALQYGFPIVEKFLAGARSIDLNFFNAKPRQNLPLILGLLGVWNSSFLGYPCRALAPYSQALHRFAAHIQQVDMESNGKRVSTEGTVLDFPTGEVDFGEPGTNGQHSFYQLFHQGRAVPVDFIGFIESQTPIDMDKEIVSNHDELMSNFFAQPDALAIGKSEDELRAEKCPELLIPHRVMPGNRPSNVLLLPRLTAYETGQLLALYEHRTAVQGFIWGLNSFDQFGVELGKVLASQVRKQLAATRKKNEQVKGFNSSTTALLNRYLGLNSKL